MGSWAADLCLKWMPRAARIAYLLTGDPDLARRIARRAVLRCSAHWHDRRNADALDEWFDKAVTSIATRSLRLRSARLAIRRRRYPVVAPTGLEAPELQVWLSLHSLRFRQRAALVLKHYGELTDYELADALGCSVAGARSLLAHGLESMESRLGDGIDATSLLRELLVRLAEGADDEAIDDRSVIRRVESARWLGVLEAGCVAAGLAAIGYLAGGAIASRGSEGGSRAPEVAEIGRLDEGGVGEAEIGAPGWCPEMEGVERRWGSFGPKGPITGAAAPFAIGLTKGNGGKAVRLAYARSNGPPLQAWPRLGSLSGIEVVSSLPGGADQGLRNECGWVVADRTWIVVLGAGRGDQSEQLALYLLRHRGEWKVWATRKPAIKL